MAKKNDDIFYGFILNEGQEAFKDAIMSDNYNSSRSSMRKHFS